MQIFPVEQHRAWMRMSQKRTCPPLDILELGGPEIEAHLKGCAHCRDELDNIKMYKDFAQGFEQSVLPKAESVPVSVGQLRAIKREAVDSIVRDGIFYVPPMVLVLEIVGKSGMVRVAQIHDEPALACPSDVLLPKVGEGYFAESWNTYFVERASLTNVLGEVPPESVSAVLSAAGNALDDIPDSPIEAFHRHEKEFSAFFERKVDTNKSAQILMFPSSFGARKKKRWGLLAVAASFFIIWAGVSFFQTPEYRSARGLALVALNQQIANGELGIVRGGASTEKQMAWLSPSFIWEGREADPSLEPRWKAYAAGQWLTRKEIGKRDNPPFPEQWVHSSNQLPDGWSDEPFYDLGVLAYMVDLACKERKSPQPGMLKPMQELVEALKPHLEEPDAKLFVEILGGQHPECSPLLDALDKMEGRFSRMK